MTGVQGQRKICHAPHFLQCAKHHCLFVDAPHAHVHIQHPGPAGLLLLRKLQHLVHTPFLQLSLQELFSGGVNALPHNEKSPLQSKLKGLPFRGQITDAGLSPRHLRERAFSNPLPQPLNMLGRGAAAPSQYSRSEGRQNRHLLRKILRIHVVAGAALLVQKRQPGVGLCDNGDPGTRGHLLNDLFQSIGACRAVNPHGGSAQTLQNHRRRPGIRAIERPAP